MRNFPAVTVRFDFNHCHIAADKLSKAGFSWGCVSAIDSNGRTIWIADAHRDDGKRFVVRADEKLAVFLELESAIRAGNAVSAGITKKKASVVVGNMAT